MARLRTTYFLILSMTFLFACQSKSPYAIKDFKKELQPYLTEIVSKGIVENSSAVYFLHKQATDDELQKLTESEHPVLRAVAFRELLERPKIKHFDLLMSHLSDTAMVATNDGEWGIGHRRVADDLIYSFTWSSKDERSKTIDEVITKHNYLSAAYTTLLRNNFTPEEKYYKYIKQMVERERTFEEKEQALFALASYRKKEDIELIKNILLENTWSLSLNSFLFMQEFQDDAYFDVLNKYYPRTFYRKICYGGFCTDVNGFIDVVASYKNEKSRKILDSMLSRKPFTSCITDTSYLRRHLVYAIWDNECIAYKELRKKVKPIFAYYESRTPREFSDSTMWVVPKKIRW